MIFLDQSLESFLERYPQLTPISIICRYCGTRVSTCHPVVLNKNEVAIVSDIYCSNCKCEVKRIIISCDKRKHVGWKK